MQFAQKLAHELWNLQPSQLTSVKPRGELEGWACMPSVDVEK